MENPRLGFGSSRRSFLQMVAGIPMGASLATALDFPTSQTLPRDQIRGHYLIKDDLVMLNSANLSPMPRVVLEGYLRWTESVDRDPSFDHRETIEVLYPASRQAVADFIGASLDEVAITRNTTESNNIVSAGLRLGPGDEVILWSQNHDSNRFPWALWAEERGFTIRTVTTPETPKQKEDLLAPFTEAFSKRTRFLSVTHVSNESGVMLPVEELCSFARSKGVLSLVDGAQSLGVLAIDVKKIGCDFFTGSGHKWLGAPRETGVLYLRKEAQKQLQVRTAGSDWETMSQQGAMRWTCFGQRDDAALAALGLAIDFQQRLGHHAVEEKVRRLAAHTKKRLAERFPQVSLRTPHAPELSAAIVFFSVPGLDHATAFRRLYKHYGIASDSWDASMPGEVAGLRLCPHVFNDEVDIERALTGISSLLTA